MFSFDCRSRQESFLRLLQTRSRVQRRSDAGKSAAAPCLACRWSASRCLVKGTGLADCTHGRYWNTTFKPAVDVAPRNHKRFSSQEDLVALIRPNFRSSGALVPRVLSCGAELASTASTTAGSEETAKRRRDPLALLSSHRQPHGKEFCVRFSRPNMQRERTRMAQDARNMFHTLPYANPEPHDHRPVSTPMINPLWFHISRPLCWMVLHSCSFLPLGHLSGLCAHQTRSWSASGGKLSVPHCTQTQSRTWLRRRSLLLVLLVSW